MQKGSIVIRRFGCRPRSTLVLGVVAACLTLASSVPTYAQPAPTGVSGGWLAGPNAAGNNTYVGRLETPRAKQNVADGANLLISGFAADTTAKGWAGFDQLQVYNGDRTKGGTKVADGIVGLSRPDIADVLGSNFNASGFSAVVKAGTLPAGADNLFVYLHTPDKGWWYKTIAVTQAAPVVLEFPADPVVTILHPTDGEIISNKQPQTALNEVVFSGFALDRNPQNDPNGLPKTNSPFGGAGNVGIQSVTLYMDLLPGQPGYNPDVNLLGGQSGGPASPVAIALGNPDSPTANTYKSSSGCRYFGNPARYCVGEFSVTKSFGPQYTFAGWVSFVNQRVLQPATWHTLYAVARSSITGKTSTAQSTFYVKEYPSNGPACSFGDFLKHKCGVVTG